MATTKTPGEHVLITPPDRYWNDSYNILLSGFEWDYANTIIDPLRSSALNLAIHVFAPSDTGIDWLLNVAASCDIVILNLAQITNKDIANGYLISKNNVWYTGREDLKPQWSRYTSDPLATLLIEIEQYQLSKGNQ